MACPIPRVPPVTIAVCPSSENIDCSAEDVILFERSRQIAIQKQEKRSSRSEAEEIRDVLPWGANNQDLGGVKANNSHFFL